MKTEGVVPDGVTSVSKKTSAPGGVDVMLSIPTRSAGTGVSGTVVQVETTVLVVVPVKKNVGIDIIAMYTAATDPTKTRQETRRRYRLSISGPM